MMRGELGDLAAFAAVAEERSFTRAAARLGTSQSAISHTVRRLEASLGIRLLSRTTRNVGLTDAGQQLLDALSPALGDIQARLDLLVQMRDQPSGSLRITSSYHAAETVLWPALDTLMERYPDIHVEVSLNNGLADIIEERYDAGLRLGEQIAKDMVALRVGPELRMLVVGSPKYFERIEAPTSPRDLTNHSCINMRNVTKGDIYAWEFEKDGHTLNVRVDGRLIINDQQTAEQAALAGHGLAYLLEDRISHHLANGSLVAVLADWSPPFPGYHLYYPNRRQLSPAFKALTQELLRRRLP